MKRTHLLLSSFALFNFLLVSCQSDGGKNNPPAIEKLFTVIWKNYDGTILETDKDVKKGAIPTYDGTTPTKPSDIHFTYTFKGWNPEITEVTKDQVYTAIYSSEKIVEETYTITWKNYDGTTLETDKDVKKGAIPTYDGATPTRPNDAEYAYTFKGWNPEITAVSKDQVYTAIYSSEKIKEETYTITWKNYDGTILEIDNEVIKDTIPTYDGATPTKPSDTQFTYTFKGWDPEVAPATQNQIYTATYTSEKIISEDEKYAKKPILSEDGKTIKYGLYPQTNVNDEALVANLNSLTNKKPNGWYLYNGEYYAKLIATPRTDNYKFDNGTLIVKKTTYWFKCEPIVWKVLSNNDGECYVLSSASLDVGKYFSYPANRTIDGQTITSSNYKYSDVRKWLNTDFYNSAFALNNSHIKTTNVDNSAATTISDTNTYICEDTQDKVFLPSYKDYTNSSYGFYKAMGATETRYSKTTDWTRARGVSLATQTGEYAYNGYYWTRSPDSERPSFVCYASYDGWLKHDYIHSDWQTYRPALTIKIS